MDTGDICLSDGRKFFVENEGYDKHLQSHGTKQTQGIVVSIRYQTGKFKPKQSQEPNCNTMKAVTNQFVKFKGLDVTGIGSVACRHSFFCHAGTVNFYGGEQ